MATISNERRLRYILLLGEGGTLVLKEILDKQRQQSGKTLEVLLEPNKTSLKRKLDKQIFQKVFPANGSPDASTWDISLLATIILQLFRKRLTGDDCNAIRSLKDFRNDLAHASSLSMDENEYDDDRRELAAALIKLSAGLDRTVHDQCQTFIKEFATGPIDIHAATERVKEFSKYDEMIHAALRPLTGKVEFIAHDLTEVKQMLLEMIGQGEDFHLFQVIGTKMALKGPSNRLTMLAEESIIRVFNSALKRTRGDEDTTKLARAIQAILSEIEDCNGVEVSDVVKECVRINLKCNNCRGLLQLLEYLEGNVFLQRLQEVATALEERFTGSFKISAEADLSSFLHSIKATADRRIILIGKIGIGKSSTGNSLLGLQAFKQRRSRKAVTQSCHLRKRYCHKRNLIYAIVDTPGLMDAEAGLAEQLLEIQRALKYCPYPHVFVLVFSFEDHLTQDDVYTIDMMRITFGEKVFDHTIVVFTRGSEFSTDEEFTKYWKESGLLVEYVTRCGGRITRIENTDSLDIDSNENVNRIYDLIEQLSHSGRRAYQYKHIKTHKEVLKDHIKYYKGKTDTQDQLSALSRSLKERLPSDIWKTILVGGAIAAGGLLAGGIGGGVVAAAGVASFLATIHKSS